MYNERPVKYSIVGIIFWCVYISGLLTTGILYKQGIKYQPIYWALIISALGISFIFDGKKVLGTLGFGGDKLKINSVVPVCIAAVVFAVSFKCM